MTEPTDAEIVALADATRTAEGGANGYILPISFCRAVLAKWGTPPAVAGEPSKVWGEFVYTEDPKRAQHARDNGIDVQPVFTTPQPTQPQAVAVPLTDEQIESLLWKYGYDPDDEYMAAMLKEVHGIKGGQHGADTRSN